LLPKHYLWAVGNDVTAYNVGDLLANRYLCKGSRIFLDTKPGLYPTAPTEVPSSFASYLRLFPYQIHVPQIYDVLSGSASNAKVALLDQAALSISSVAVEGDGSALEGAAIAVEVLPALVDSWTTASALRQLNWLWQIAHLWQPFSSEQVASSLIAADLVRVEGTLIRLLELRADVTKPLPLAQLGQFWSHLTPTAQPEIGDGLHQICQRLIQNQIRNSEQLISDLDILLSEVGRSHSRQIQMVTRTDRGPSRQRNEDACYPADGPSQSIIVSPDHSPSVGSSPLVIVCDGIGGHQGGDVASHLAIEVLRQQVQLLEPEKLDSSALTTALEQAVCVANDSISQRNDTEQRFERQRMGTTVVMGLVRAHELYITHVGDSRVYWINRQGCHQVTLDDDVASREVRLGYSPYREALQQPSSGSLVQALGMGASSVLHPTVQRFIPDEDSVFLLCSDGLSDNDRVEEYWETVFIPLFDGKIDIDTASQQLIDIANTRNGHDNVTVGLLYLQIKAPLHQRSQQQPRPRVIVPNSPPTLIQTNQDTYIQAEPETSSPAHSTLKTQVLPRTAQRGRFKILPLIFWMGLLLSSGGLLAYMLSFGFRGWVDSLLGQGGSSNPEAMAPVSPGVSPSPIATLTVGSFVELNPATIEPNLTPNPTDAASPLMLSPQPGVTLQAPIEARIIPLGSILQVTGKQATASQEQWVKLQICSVPSLPNATLNSSPGPVVSPGSSPTSLKDSKASPGSKIESKPQPVIQELPGSTNSPADAISPKGLQPGDQGWISERQILSAAVTKSLVTPTERGSCSATSPPQHLETPGASPPKMTKPSLS
jgi:serine/threonine protein phosphatase PrpC